MSKTHIFRVIMSNTVMSDFADEFSIIILKNRPAVTAEYVDNVVCTLLSADW